MGEHKKIDGITVINSLSALGEVLGYKVKNEYPMQEDEINPETIDLAWMREENNRYPIMIFEVESIIGGYVNNNPVKIYGKTTEEFQKPLFFFHIFMKGKSNSRKIANLQGAFGTHNYKAYLLEEYNITKLLVDILDQHRRINSSINLYSLLEYIKGDAYLWEHVDLNKLLIDIEEKISQDEEGILFPTYIKLAIEEKKFEEHVFRVLYKRKIRGSILENIDDYNKAGFDSYWGEWWCVPIYISLMCHKSNNKQDYFELFKNWQETSSFMPMIGPFLGLSQDYDDFIYFYSGIFLACIICMVKDMKCFTDYIIKITLEIFNKIKEEDGVYFYNFSVWLLNILAVDSRNMKTYEYVRDIINSKGGCNKEFMYSPSIKSCDEEQDLELNKLLIPDIEEFNKVSKSYWISSNEIRSLTTNIFELLVNYRSIDDIASEIIYYLYN